MDASTTRAPSSSRRATYCSAERFSGAGAPPTDGGRVSRPTVSPRSRGRGTAAPVSTDHMSAASATLVAIGPTVSNVGQSGKTPSVGIRPHAGLSPTTSQHAAGSRNRAACVGADADVAEPRRERCSVPARRPAGRAARVRGIVHRPVPRVLARHTPRELVQVRLADDDRTGVDEPLHGRCGPRRHVVGVDLRAVRRADARRVDQILDE